MPVPPRGPARRRIVERYLQEPLISAGGGFAPQSVVPGQATLALTSFAPSVSTPVGIVPGVRALVLARFAPVVSTPRLVTIPTASLVLTRFAPSIATPRIVVPGVAALTLATFAPDVTVAGGSKTVTPDTAALVLTTFAPIVTASVPAVIPEVGGARYRRPVVQPAQPQLPARLPTPRWQPVVVPAVAVDNTDAIVALYVQGAIDIEEFAALLAA